MDLGTKIKQLRKDNGLTQQQLADLIFKTKRTLEKYENNEIDISVSTLIDISKILNVSLLSLLVDDPNDMLSIIKDYYNLEDKAGFNMEHDFELIIKGFSERYKK